MLEKPYLSQEKEQTSSCDVDEQDFAATANDYRPQIFRFLLASLRDPDLAEELTQECFLRAHRNWSRFRGDATIATWLMRIAINLQKDYWRSKRIQFWREVHRDSFDTADICDWTPSREMSPEAQITAREQVALVWKAVQRMQEKQRSVFLLRFVEELKIGEIAEVTGMQVGTVKLHLFRALSKVRTTLERA